MTDFKKHEVDWTKEKISKFWDYFVDNHGLRELSFARETGPSIIKLVRKYIKNNGKNLDYGCGGGYLIEYLIKEGINCEGLDASKDSVEKTKKRLENKENFEGAFLSEGNINKKIEDNSYDFIFLIETIEHLIPDDRKEILEDIFRILKPGGYIFISTPNKEKLDKYKVICPDCGAIFHRVQHVNSYTPDNLSELMNGFGFHKEFCYGTLLTPKTNFLNSLKFRIKKILSKNKFKPHLVYLGKK